VSLSRPRSWNALTTMPQIHQLGHVQSELPERMGQFVVTAQLEPQGRCSTFSLLPQTVRVPNWCPGTPRICPTLCRRTTRCDLRSRSTSRHTRWLTSTARRRTPSGPTWSAPILGRAWVQRASTLYDVHCPVAAYVCVADSSPHPEIWTRNDRLDV
jgi:hypothetical protein